MPRVPIPLFTAVHKGVDDVVLADNAAIQYNGYIDELGGLNIRPGEASAVTIGRRNNGLYYWPDTNFVVAVAEGYIDLYTINALTTLTEVSGGGFTPIATNSVATFTNTTDYVYVACGGKIQRIDQSAVVTEISDLDAPESVTHVGFLDGYILAIDNNNKLRWSAVNDGSSWAALDFVSAEGGVDVLRAMYIVQRQVYLLGSTTTEIWENDGETPFSRIPGGLIELGCGAKYSGIKYANSLIWLTNNRQFVKFTGTAVEFISSPYDREVASFSTVEDCIGNFFYKNGQEYCLFHFPTEGRTLAYNPVTQDWSEWATWNPDTLEWDAYDIRGATTDTRSGEVFIGKTTAEMIARLDTTSRDDYVAPATHRKFKFLRRTGWIDHGTAKQKRLEALRFRAKRGDLDTAVSDDADLPQLLIRYRNNGSSQWSNTISVSLGNRGEFEHHIQLRRLGIYRSRQFEISVASDVSVVLSNAEADLTELR